MKNTIKDIIHLLTTEMGIRIYSSLYFCNNEKIQDFTFNFSFSKNIKKHFGVSEYDSLKEDVRFLLDNIISKTFELNYNVDYTKTSFLGMKIYYNGEEYTNPYIVSNYHINDPNLKISDLENYLDDIEIIESHDRYTIKWKIPIYKIDKSKITVDY